MHVFKSKICTNIIKAQTNVRRVFLMRHHDEWSTIPKTQIKYECKDDNHYFEYSYDTELPSYYFTKNIKSLTITCNEDG